MIEPGKLKWLCRRGSLELDLILQKYLTSHYNLATDEERAQFIELLNLEDSELLKVMLEKLHADL
jgi:antitoxin CptB